MDSSKIDANDLDKKGNLFSVFRGLRDSCVITRNRFGDILKQRKLNINPILLADCFPLLQKSKNLINESRRLVALYSPNGQAIELYFLCPPNYWTPYDDWERVGVFITTDKIKNPSVDDVQKLLEK